MALAGGGDAKIIPAAAVLIGYRELLGFLFLMSLCGGALALATLAVEKLGRPLMGLWRPAHGPPIIAGATRDRLARKDVSVPYGVAVAAAGVLTLLAAR